MPHKKYTFGAVRRALVTTSTQARHSDGGLGVTGCVPPVWPLYFGTLLHSLSDLMQQKGRLMHAYLEKAYNFGFSRGGPRCPPRPRIWRPRPIRKHPKFSKAPLRGAEILFSQGRAKKLARTRKKMGSNLGSKPGVCKCPSLLASRPACPHRARRAWHGLPVWPDTALRRGKGR